MKRNLWKLSLCVCLVALAMLALTVSADAEEQEHYRMYGEGTSFALSHISASEETVLVEGTAEEVFSALRELGDGGAVCSVHFASINTSQTLSLLKGTYRLTGELTMSEGARLELSDTADLTLGELSLTFSANADGTSGYIRAKDGTLTVDGATVSAEGSAAVVLDYAAGAHVTVLDGHIRASAQAAIRTSTGTVEILGGKVECTGAYAIETQSTVRLGGAPTLSGTVAEIATDGPVWLSCRSIPLTSQVRVKYGALFKKGTSQAVLYGATAEMKERVTLYDLEGAAMPLVYMERMGDEADVLAVSRPFTVRFFSEGVCIEEQTCLLSQTLIPPAAPAKEGYTFDGWYCGGASDTPFTGTVSEDTDVMTRYRLSAPTYHLSSLSFIYDGQAHTLGFDVLTHPLAEVGVYQYTWYKDGDALTEARPALSLSRVSDSGRYRCRVTLTVGNDTVSVTTAEVEVSIRAREVPLPTLTAVPFSGQLQSAAVPFGADYTVTENAGGVHVGSYPVILSLADPENTVWQGGDTADVTLSFEITRASNTFLGEVSARDCFEGQAPSVSAVAKYGKCYLLFAKEGDGDYTLDAPTAVGEYVLRVCVDETDDYEGLLSEPLPFAVMAVRPEALRQITPPECTSYVAFDLFSTEGLTVAVLMNDGTERILTAEELTVAYADGRSCLYAGDAFVFLCYEGLSLPVTVEVARAEYDLSGILFPSGERVYNGQLQELTIEGTLPVGKDGHELAVVYEGFGRDVGEYTVTARFVTVSEQYATPAPLYATLTVTPCPVQVTWSDLSFVYNGTYQVPMPTAYDLAGQPLALTVSGAACLAGDGYVASCLASNPNYTLLCDIVSFSIKKAVYDLSEVHWSQSAFVYDGTAHSVRLEGLPEGVSVLGYTDASATNAGTYTARVTLAYDTKNYEEPCIEAHTYTISPAAYDMSEIAFPPATYVYTGDVHYPTPEGMLPIGYDGSSPKVHMSTGARDVTDGTVTVTVTFESTSKNYLPPPSIQTTVTVIPRGITVTWGETVFTYDGDVHAPAALCDTAEITVTGAVADAGAYVATAQAVNPNFTVTNPRCAFTVEKAANAWLIPLTVADTFVGRAPEGRASAAVGEVRIVWYADEAMTQPIDRPTEAGRYFAVASVTGEKNYEDLIGEPVAFSMIPVVATGLSVTLLKDTFSAFEKLCPSDASVTLLYNDDHTETVAAERWQVSYATPDADSLRYADTYVTVEAHGFAVRCAVRVEKAALPLAGVTWQAQGLVYTGDAQTVTLTGLAEGIRVREYIGATVTEAGEYTVTAVLEFDRDNYAHEGYLCHTFTVARATIPTPALPSDIYTGKWQQAAVAPSPLYTVTQTAVGRTAGEYPLTLTVADVKNYCFEGGEESITLVYRILPRPVTVTVEDVYLYIDRSTPTVSYTLTEGEVCEGDALALSFSVVNGEICATSDSPNYDVTFSLGRVIATGRLSPERRGGVWLLLLTVVLLLLLLGILWLRRDRLRYLFRRRAVRTAGLSSVPFRPSLPAPPATPSPISPAPVIFEPQENSHEPSFADACRMADALLSFDRPHSPSAECEARTRIPDIAVTNEPPAFVAEPDSPAPHGAVGERASAEESLASLHAVDAERADALISDDLAGHLLVREPLTVRTFGRRRVILNVDALSRAFTSGERVDVNILKDKYLIPYDAGYLKILAGGSLDKALEVYADSFSLQAVKMIALTGGHAVRAITVGEDVPKGKKIRAKAKKTVEKDTTV